MNLKNVHNMFPLEEDAKTYIVNKVTGCQYKEN